MNRLTVRLWQVAPTVLVAMLVFQTLRTFWLERYVVASDSMEPTLYGDPISGDRVLVDKSAAWWWNPVRGDLVVIRNPEDPQSHLIKRAMAFGGERVRLMRGDIFLWNPELGDWMRWEKDPLRFRDMRMTYFEFPGGGETPVEGFMQGLQGERLEAAGADLADLRGLLDGKVPGFRLPGHLGIANAVDTRFLDARGTLRGNALLCEDIGMEIDVAVESGLTGLQLVFEYRGDRFWWSYRSDGEVQFQSAGSSHGEPVQAPPLSPGELLRIEFGYLDGRFFLIVGDRLLGLWNVALPVFGDGQPIFPGSGLRPHNSLYVGAAGASVGVPRVRVFHDVYYEALDRAFQKPEVDVPPGEIWLLGDNTFDSRDSRSMGGYPQSEIVGRPVMILGPLHRFRLLPR